MVKRNCLLGKHLQSSESLIQLHIAVTSLQTKNILKMTLVSLAKPFPPSLEKTMPEFLLARAQEYFNKGKSIYLIDGSTDEKRYFQNFEDETRKIASHFFKKGLGKGDIVVYLTTKQINQVVMLAGVWRANGIIRSIYADEGQETILDKVKESNAKWVLCDYDNASEIQNTLKCLEWDVEIVICDKQQDFSLSNGVTNFQEYLDDDGIECPELDLCENDVALILPTSGTTGASKGAMHTHKSCVLTTRLFSYIGWNGSKPNIIASKSTHISGLFLPFIMLSRGFTGIVLAKNSAEILIQTVDKYKPGVIFAFPSFVLALGTNKAKGFDISSVSTLVTGGSSSTPEMKKAYLSIGNVKKIFNCYGLTETVMGANSRNFECDLEQESESDPSVYEDVPDFAVGKVYPGHSAQIRDLEDISKILGPNQKGELVLKGDALFVGYFKDPKKTEEAFIDGWFRTGDVGFYDDKGFVYIVDRSKDIFKYFHNHISPTELENIIAKHSLVQEACVIGVPDVGGEVPRAFVTLKTKPSKEELPKIAEDIKSFANEKLASYKHLRGGVFIMDELPKGKTGKVAKNLLFDLKD